MSGETDLAALLSGMRPELNPGEYVFCTIEGRVVPPGLHPVATVAEAEGLTLVLPRPEADEAALPYDYVAGWITLRIHSALDAVGLTGAFARELAGAGLSCNVIAGYHHDHLFVPVERAPEAVALLEGLAARSAS
ncbi:ACT domain-containing protein [Streptomyces sp. NPDC089919]|uniref:ACT domain-containing protein n=1 Tax=Streptomyces sp. NPDC089919 TaxID=3155188 RepID=UPI003416BF3A